MSGGSRNYTYSIIEEEYVGKMFDAELDDLMKDVVELAHDVEWYDSGDYGHDTYRKCVKKFKDKWFKKPRTERLKEYVDKEIDTLKQKLYELVEAKE